MKNVLLITVDSLRADHVGYHGYDRETTPHMDAYAAEGSRFTRAFAHVGGTRFSFPSILTSVTPMMYGGHDRVDDEQTPVAEVFQDAGYQTAGFHSNLYISADYGYGRGFDTFFDSRDDPSFLTRARRYVKKNLKDSPVFPVLKEAYDFVESSSGVNVGSSHVPAPDLTEMAVDWIESTDPDRPSFLWVHYMDVHHPFLPPEEYQRLFRDEVIEPRDAIKRRRKLLEAPEDVTEAELETMLDLYDAEIRHTDDQVHRLVEAANERWDDVLTLLTSDHGEHFLERGYFSGAQPYDVKLHVPLFVHGWDDDGEYEELVGLTDVPPTLLDHAGLEIPETYQGYSLRDVVFRDRWDRTEVIGAWGMEDTRYVYRDDRWKYIEWDDGERELYDVTTDPEEKANVVDEEANAEVVERLGNRMDAHRRDIRRTDTGVGSVQRDEDVRERLRRLGYDE